MTPLARRLIDHAALSGPFDVARFLYAEPGRAKPSRADVSEALKLLAPMCDEVVRDGRILWMMNDADRADTLRDLMRREGDRARRWRKRPPPKGDVFGRVLRACLTQGRALDAAALTDGGDDAAEIVRAAIAAAVFAAPLVAPTRAAEVAAFERELYRRSVALAEEARRRVALPHGLIGRTEERAHVMAFLAAPPREPDRVPRLLLTAGPGMGKSAFLSDLMQRLEAAGTRVVHFDFDRVTLARGGPVAWVEEMTRQIGVQAPRVEAELSALRSRHAERRQNAFEPGLAPAPEVLLEDALAIIAKVERAPVVVLLDTVEQIIAQDNREAFHSDPDHTLLLQLLAWVDRLRPLGPERGPADPPAVAAILAARAEPPVTEAVLDAWFDLGLVLGPLPFDDATLLLARYDPRLDAGTRQRIVASVGGVPLHLTLVARRLAGLDPERREQAIAALGRGGLAAMAPEQALATLERRFLDRMSLDELPGGLTVETFRALANPGLLLRELTEETLVKVVAPAVAVDLSDPLMAHAAFDALVQQGWLVTPTLGGRAMRQLPEVRRAMLPLMLNEDAGASARVLAAGIAFHEPDPAHPDIEAAYLRALSGEADWFVDHPDMARSVAASAGADFEAMPLPVRAVLKLHAPDVRGLLDAAEAEALPAAAPERRPAEDIRAAETPRQALRVAPAAPPAGTDAYDLLNDSGLHREVDEAFLATDFARVADIGWSTLRRFRRWPDMDRALGARGPFRDHWLWRLALVSTIVPPPDDWAGIGPLAQILACTHPAFPAHGPYPDPLAGSAPAIFDFDLFCGMVSGQPFARPIEPAEVLDIRVGGVLRAQRVLGGSRWVRALARARGIEQVTFDRIDQIPLYYEAFFRRRREPREGAGPDEHVIPWVDVALAGGNPAPQPIRFRLWPREIDELARRNVALRGQTPELHRALAASVLAEGANATLRDVLSAIAPNLRDPAAPAILAELAAARSRRDEIELIGAVLHRADYCGLLPRIVKDLSDAHPGGRLATLATLLAALGTRWTWPPAPGA